jgi:mRNA interferase HicA
VKRVELLKTIRKAAKIGGVEFVLVREGSEHSVYRYGTQQVVVPRHRELNEITARAILKDLGLA